MNKSSLHITINWPTLLILCALVVTPVLAQGIEPTFNGLAKEMSEQAKVIVGMKDQLDSIERKLDRVLDRLRK